ncbi:MAG: class I SAM-dependent methyltransferase [Candidatus Thiodiazotropha sp.]
MVGDNNIDALNKQTMCDSVKQYSLNAELTKPEAAALSTVTNAKDKPILDLGVGAGRTVSALRKISENYVGIDYVADMVDECRRKYPGVRFEQGDARKLTKFHDNTFHMVMFSMNGISMVNHEGRIEILKEVFRVLAPGGTFLFSTYNRDFDGHMKFFRFPKFHYSSNPLKFGVRALKYGFNMLLALGNRLRFRRLEIHTEEYSLVNDRCHNYATMLYYITHPHQQQQLIAAGFDRDVLAFDALGSQLLDSTAFDSIFYVARKPL